MLQRVLFVAITLFWLVMNYLLWQAEHFGARVPVPTVARVILNPEEDINNYDIYLIGEMENPIGSFTFTARSLDSKGVPLMADNVQRRVAGYSIEIDGTPPETSGSVHLGGQEVRVNLDIQFDRRRNWKYFLLTLGPEYSVGTKPPWNVTIVGDTTNNVVQFGMMRQGESVDEPLDKTFADLDRWQSLMEVAAWMVDNTLGRDNDVYSRLANAVQLLTVPAKLAGADQGKAPRGLGRFELDWEARYGTLPDYTPQRRVYRLEAPLHEMLGNQPVVVYVDRGGDILRARIPFANIEIRNRRFYPLPTGN